MENKGLLPAFNEDCLEDCPEDCLEDSGTDLQVSKTGAHRSIPRNHLFQKSWAPFAAHLAAFIMYSTLFMLQYRSLPTSAGPVPLKQWPDIYDNTPNQEEVVKIPIRLKEDPFSQVSAKGRFDESAITHTEFEGRPNGENDKAWEDLLQLGPISVSRDEMSRLPFDTAPNVMKDGEYVVSLNVFHQLHCLHGLRHQLWNPVTFAWKEGEPVGWWEFHMSHCIETLRQTLVCNADLTPLRYMYEEEIYTLSFPQQYKCKNWEEVWEWAKARNTTGDCPRYMVESEEPRVCHTPKPKSTQ